MAFEKLLFKRKAKKKEFRSHCRPEYLKIINTGKSLTPSCLPKRMNSYEHNLFMPLWNNELLIKKVKYYIGQAGGEFYQTDKYVIDSCYNDAIKHKMIFMLIERLEKLMKKKECQHDYGLHFTDWQERCYQYKCSKCKEIIYIGMDD